MFQQISLRLAVLALSSKDIFVGSFCLKGSVIMRISVSVSAVLACLLSLGVSLNASASQTVLNEARSTNDFPLPAGTNLLVGATPSPATVVSHEPSPTH